MKKIARLFIYLVFLLASDISVSNAQVQQFQDDDLTPEMFSTYLKNEWVFLRDGIDQMNAEIGKRGEFETTPEFQARAVRVKQNFSEKLTRHIKETKLDKRMFGVWFKAVLLSYDADTEIYSLQSSTTLESPYDIPNVECFIPENPYVELADSIKGGYRTSNIRLKFNPDFKLKLARTEAMTMRGNEQNIYFKLRFTLDISQENLAAQARLKIIPKNITLMHQQNKYVYWKDEIK